MLKSYNKRLGISHKYPIYTSSTDDLSAIHLIISHVYSPVLIDLTLKSFKPYYVAVFCGMSRLIDNKHPTHWSPLDEQKFPVDHNYPLKCFVHRISTATTLISLITLFNRWSFNAVERNFTRIMLWCSFLDGFVHGNRSLFGLGMWAAFDILYMLMCNLSITGAGWCGRAQLWLRWD